jgi:DNA adenine methylase
VSSHAAQTPPHQLVQAETVKCVGGPLSATPRPFLRWAGSKRAYVAKLLEPIPREFGRYFEPFLGSGALFFALRPSEATLADACSELIDVYDAVRTDPDAVYRAATTPSMTSDAYYAVRSARSSDALVRAGEFIYLNHACWNGLYRVNSRGEFNVPFGRPRSTFVADLDNIRACHRLLASEGVRLEAGDFEESLKDCGRGDVVFLDPPYVTSHNNNGFIDYNEKLFSWNDQLRLARLAQDLVQRGCHVLVTNAHHADVIDLYPTFSVSTINRSSTLASDRTKRGRVAEALFIGRPTDG